MTDMKSLEGFLAIKSPAPVDAITYLSEMMITKNLGFGGLLHNV